ncbi:hypothetical protein ACQR1N_28400 [Bradyrhizobium sp. HKCCYLRH1073]|uniref:hypothetical protein n=1 Tax=unclassified Bradyrhizobium TaxID=2631580 RepID=UPI003EC0D4F1
MTGLAPLQWEFSRKLAALTDEVEAWISETKTSPNFQRHKSQVEAFAEMLGVIRKELERPLVDRADASDGAKVLLGLFRIWEFLRAKLAQRRETRFQSFLRIADEYAWLCYQPIYNHGMKEPPLVFLNGGYSPFTLVRRSRFQAESVPQELIRGRALINAMENLPFPVIGVPWYQYDNYADLTVIGHEVGHSIEADLGLTQPIKDAIAAAVHDEVRSRRWMGWGSEAFADLYGVMAGGVAFISALANFLAHEDPCAETPGYPPVPLRVRFNIAALEGLNGSDRETATLRSRWEVAFPLPVDQVNYCGDLIPLVANLLDGITNGKQKLRDWLPFKADHLRAHALANDALASNFVKNEESFSALAVAYRLGYDQIISGDSAKYDVLFPELHGLKDAMIGGMQLGLRSGELDHERAPSKIASARERRAQAWLQNFRGSRSRKQPFIPDA